MAFSFSQTSGPSGVTTITVSATSRTEITDIANTYTLSNTSGNSLVFGVSQTGYKPVEKYIEFSPLSFVCEPSGGTGSLQISSNDDWVIIANSWIGLSNISYSKGELDDERYNIIRGNGNTIIGLIFSKNSGEARTGTISGYCISDTAVTAETIVQQAQYVAPYLTLDNWEFDIPSTGESSVEIGVSSNCTWTAYTTSDWITFNSSSGDGDGSVVFNVDENKDALERSAIIFITALTQSLATGVRVNQSGATKPYIYLNPSSFSVPASGSTGNIISVSANCSYKIDTDVNWIIPSTTGGTGNTVVTFSTNGSVIKGNDVGNIEFFNESVSAFATVEREQEAPYISASTETINFRVGQTSFTNFSVHSNIEWNAFVYCEGYESKPWISINPTSGEGNALIRVTPSNIISERTGYIYIENSTIGVRYEITVNVVA